jgi:hypothetical protein
MIFHWAVNRNVKSFVIADGFYYAGYDVIDGFLALLIVDRIAPGRSDLMGYAFSYYYLLRSLVELPLSRLSRNSSLLRKRTVIGFGYLLYACFVLLLGVSSSLWEVFFILTVMAVIDALLYPMKWTIFTKILDRRNQEFEWGLEDLFSTLLPAIFTAVAGFVSAAYGLEATFALFAALFALSGVTFFFIRPRS